MTNQQDRDQIADLILKDYDGKDLVFTSNLQHDGNVFWFEIGEDDPDGARYQVKIEIKEV